MKRFAFLLLAGCNLYFAGGGDDHVTPPGDDVEYVPDAAPYLPDAQGPVRFVWWASRQAVTPDYACAPYLLTSTAATAPVLGSELVLTTTGDESIAYSQSGADLNASVTLTASIEGRFRVQSGAAGYHFLYGELGDGITVNANGSAVTDSGTIFTVDAATAHSYQMLVHHVSGVVDISIDGSQVFTEPALPAPGAAPAVTWGSAEAGTSYWTDVAHDMHADILCPLP